MSFIRRIKKKSGVYLAEVESYRENGKIKQRLIKYLGKEVNGKAVRKVNTSDIRLKSVKRSFDILAIHTLMSELGLLKLIKNKVILALVFSQILEEFSINKLEYWFSYTEIPEILNLESYSTKELYNALSDTEELNFDDIQKHLVEQFSKFSSINKGVIIDITDTYFEGKSLGIKSRRGKDSKVKPLIQFGLAVSQEDGFPLFHRVYDGNLSDIHILKDMSLRLRKLNFDSLIIDRGMSSKENINLILNEGLKIIAGLRKNPKLERDFLSKSKDIYQLENRIQLKSTAVYVKEFKYEDGKLIVVFNPHIALFHKERAFEKGISKEGFYGYSLIFHNTLLDSKEVVRQYYQKEIVERAFREMKGVLNIRPMRVWLKKHIEGHFRICYLAYAILSLMRFKLKKSEFSEIEALKSLRYGYKVSLYDKVNKHQWDLTVPLKPKQRKILRLLGVVNKK